MPVLTEIRDASDEESTRMLRQFQTHGPFTRALIQIAADWRVLAGRLLHTSEPGESNFTLGWVVSAAALVSSAGPLLSSLVGLPGEVTCQETANERWTGGVGAGEGRVQLGT